MAKEKKDVPVFVLELRADDPRAVAMIRNRMRLLTLPGDREEYDKLKAARKEFEEWVARATAK